MLVARLVVAFAFIAPLASAQPAAEAVVGAWRQEWREAAATVRGVTMDESARRTLAGPRGTITVETESRVRYAPGTRAVRDVVRATVNGQSVAPERLEDLADRHTRALGVGDGPWRLPPSPDALLARARPTGLTAETLDGATVWRVDLWLPPPDDRPPPPRRGERGRRPPPGGPPPEPPRRAVAWFAPPAAAPRLVRLFVPLGPDGRDALTVDFERVGGLDLPVASSATLTVRQRRRLRDFAVTATHAARYGQHRVERR